MGKRLRFDGDPFKIFQASTAHVSGLRDGGHNFTICFVEADGISRSSPLSEIVQGPCYGRDLPDACACGRNHWFWRLRRSTITSRIG